MYLQPDEAMDLIRQCAKRFPGGQMFFDLPPTILKKVAPKGIGPRTYRVPPMPFSLSVNQLRALVGRFRTSRRCTTCRCPPGWVRLQDGVSGILAFRAMKPFRGVYALLDFG